MLLDDVLNMSLSLLARKGAFSSSQSSINSGTGKYMYSLDDLRIVVTYAKDRGIEVVPEVDVPAHALYVNS